MGRPRGRYPIIRREILRLAKKAVTETKTARKGVRKTGFRPISSDASGVGGSPILILPPCAYTAEGGGGTPPDGFLAKYVSQDTPGIFDAFQHSVVVTSMDGVAWVHGQNGYGQFGLGHADYVTGWEPVPGLPPLTKAVYFRQSVFFLAETGEVYGAGLNDLGQIMPGTTDDQWSPVALETLPTNIVDVVASAQGTYHALTDENTVYTWGDGAASQFGDGTHVNPHFEEMPFLNTYVGGDVEQIACGYSWTLVRKTDGTVYGFGYIGTSPGDASFLSTDDPGVFYDGDNVNYYVPSPVELPLGTPDCVDISAGGHGALYVFADGSARISDNVFGGWQQWYRSTPKIADFYPDGPDYPDPGYGTPTFYGILEGVGTAVRGWTRGNGSGHALLLEDGSLYAFGRNDHHDLGDGTDLPSSGVAYEMYSAGTVLLTENPVSFSGTSTYGGSFPSVLGDYYVVNPDGTLLYWSDTAPAAINSEIG